VTSKSKHAFQNVSQRVIVRISVADWLRILATSALYVFGAATVLAAALWFIGIHLFNIISAGALVLAYLIATAVWAWLRRPTAATAFAIWDERAGRDEGFVSAYCFEAQDERTVGEQLHLDRAASQLTDEMSKLKRDLPLPLWHRIWISPLVFVAIVALVLVTPSLPGRSVIGEKDRARAREVAQKLDTSKHLLDEQGSLDPKEKEEIEKLKKSMDEAVDDLRKLTSETRREVLAELERKAHEAETLADALGGGAGKMLSSEMLAELERHVDTANLASALQADNLANASKESKELAKRLENQELSLEESKRIEYAFDKAMSVAGNSDKQSMVGKHIGQSLEQLKKKQPQKAANELSELSRQLQQQLQRQSTKNQLEQLAQQLRKAGQQIFEQNQSEVRRIAQNPPTGMRQLSDEQSKTLRDMHLQLQPGGSLQGQMGDPNDLSENIAKGNSPASGSQRPGNQGQGQPASEFPIPGTDHSQTAGQSAGQPPIPGSGSMPSTGSGSGQNGAIPIPGTAAADAGVGGLYAGHGTAPMGTAVTIPRDATNTGVVDAQASGKGPSVVRSSDGQMHREDAVRDTKQLALKFIKTEESALADESIPLSRRDQVLRYFKALRKQLVESKAE
jgi:hypothetical protein